MHSQGDIIRRLFWGFDLETQWPPLLKDGRVLAPDYRHATISFLGELKLESLKDYLENFSLKNQGALTGFIDSFIQLPESRKPRVLCLTGRLDDEDKTLALVSKIREDMIKLGLKTSDRKDWLFHVTVARGPFKSPKPASEARAYWEKHGKTERIPFYFKSLCLYQSLPGLIYKKIYSYTLAKP